MIIALFAAVACGWGDDPPDLWATCSKNSDCSTNNCYDSKDFGKWCIRSRRNVQDKEPLARIVDLLEEIVEKKEARLSLSDMLANRQNAPFNCKRCMMCSICSTDRNAAVCASSVCTEKCQPGSTCFMEKKCKDLSPTGCDSCLQDMDCVYNTANDMCLYGVTAPMENTIVWAVESCPVESMNVCSTYSDCASCMESEACLFDKADGTCYFGETAPMVMTLAFSAGDC